VCDIGAVDQRIYFAYGCGEVVDTTNDGGKHWWRSYLGGSLAIVGSSESLVALNEGLSEGPTAITWVYVSRDGGRIWHYDDHTLGAV
jgi:photosystem II stability/assembly factor-like uncharacterized protein